VQVHAITGSTKAANIGQQHRLSLRATPFHISR
jgi:hypothetical protein